MYFSSERTHCLMDGMAILIQAHSGDTRAFSSVTISENGKVAEGFCSDRMGGAPIPFRVSVNDKGALKIAVQDQDVSQRYIDRALALVGGGYLAEPDASGEMVIRYHSGEEYDQNRARHLSKACDARIYMDAEGEERGAATREAERVLNDLSAMRGMVGKSSDHALMADGKERRTYLVRMSQAAFLRAVGNIISEQYSAQFSEGIIFNNMDAIKQSLDATPEREFNGLPREVMSLALERHPEIFRNTAITITPEHYDRLNGAILLHPLTRRIEAMVRGADRIPDEYKPVIAGASRDLTASFQDEKGGAKPLGSTFYFKNDDLDSIKDVLGSPSAHAAILTILSEHGLGSQGGKITVEDIADPHRNDDMSLVRVSAGDEYMIVSTAGTVGGAEYVPGYTGVSLSWRDDDYRSDKLLALVNAVEASLLNVGGCLREAIPAEKPAGRERSTGKGDLNL